MNSKRETEESNEITIEQRCTQCDFVDDIDRMLTNCPVCKSKLQYVYEGTYNGKTYDQYDSIWKNLDLIPLKNQNNIISLGEGNSDIIEFSEISPLINGAKLFLMMDSDKNPTGVFKDREASIILSRCREMNLDNLVFYSTANTGRSYTHYAAHMGLTTYLFMPKQCAYKMTKHIKKNKNNFIIYVDDNYSQIAPFAKKFAEVNGFTAIAPLQDRNEAYATVAYEQFQKLKSCNYFVQTIASGMGPIGFLRGHKNLVKFGIQTKENIPRIVCVQSSQMNVMSTAYNDNKESITSADVHLNFVSDLYEPTLNSTNPVNNYPDLYNCLKDTDGIITDVDPEFIELNSTIIIEAFKKRKIYLRSQIEKSIFIEFAGLIKLAKQGHFKEGEVIMMLACGRGKDKSTELYQADAIINPLECDPHQLNLQLKALL